MITGKPNSDRGHEQTNQLQDTKLVIGIHLLNHASCAISCNYCVCVCECIHNRNHTHTVADLGFSERGFCYSIARKARTKNFATTLTFG